MNLEYAIRNRWQTTSSLQNRLPVKYLVFGSNPYTHLPRATIQIDNFSIGARTNLGVAAKKMTINFVVIDDDYQISSEMISEIINTYDGIQMESSENRALITLKFCNSELKQTESIWTATIQFDTRIIYC